MPPQKKEPKREVRVTRITVTVFCDLLEDGEKIDEAVAGPSDSAGVTQPFVFFNVEQVKKWADSFPSDLAGLTG